MSKFLQLFPKGSATPCTIAFGLDGGQSDFTHLCVWSSPYHEGSSRSTCDETSREEHGGLILDWNMIGHGCGGGSGGGIPRYVLIDTTRIIVNLYVILDYDIAVIVILHYC